MEDRQRQYELSSRRSLAAIRQVLGHELALIPRPPAWFKRRYYDTFDWRLYRQGWVLEFDEHESFGRLRLRGRGADVPVLELALVSMPAFPAELPAGRLRERLEKLCKRRALLTIASVHLRVSPFEIHNASDKVTVRLTNIQYCSNRQAPTRHIHRQLLLEPLRGYGDAAALTRDVVERRLALKPETEDPFDRVCRLHGLQPGRYQTKLRIPLEPDERSDQALARLLVFLLDIMETNEAGIQEDIDTEFLHDFRIACRRSRALVNQVRHVLPSQELRRYQAAFKWLSQATGPCRDLDVFLLDLPSLAQRAGVQSTDTLLTLRSVLEEQRRQARAGLLDTLRAERYRRFKQDWRTLLETAAAGDCHTRQSATPVKSAADVSIWRLYKKIRKEGAALDPDTDPIALHELRKTGKKLRYLLEAFGSLYSPEDIAAVVNALKKLQDNLGGIVDASVQSETLQQIRNRLSDQVADDVTMQTLQQLIDYCDERHHMLLMEFQPRFERFARRKNRNRCKQLFKPA